MSTLGNCLTSTATLAVAGGGSESKFDILVEKHLCEAQIKVYPNRTEPLPGPIKTVAFTGVAHLFSAQPFYGLVPPFHHGISWNLHEEVALTDSVIS